MIPKLCLLGILTPFVSTSKKYIEPREKYSLVRFVYLMIMNINIKILTHHNLRNQRMTEAVDWLGLGPQDTQLRLHFWLH